MCIRDSGFTGVINNGKRDLGFVGEGVEPSAEAKLGTYLKYIEGRALADSDKDGIVLEMCIRDRDNCILNYLPSIFFAWQ